jgi:hypothetical protein
MKALIRVQPKYRPVSGDFQGMRIQAALPNKAARKMIRTNGGFRATATEVPAFRKPYLIAETGDQYSFSESDLERFKQKLKWEGFSEFEMLTTIDGRKVSDMPADVKREFEAMQKKLSDALF